MSQFETAIRHEVSIQRLASEIVASQINPAMLNLNELVRRLMLDYSEDMTNREFNALRTRTERQLRKALNEMWSGVTKELEGLAVFTQFGGQRQCLGRVSKLFETGANDVLVVVGDAESIDLRERLIPYVPEQFVLGIDLEAGEILVDWDPEF